MKTKITKLEGKEGSALKVGYWVTGYTALPLEIGRRFYLNSPIRTSLNERGYDYFTTTKVTEIGDGFFRTENSKWNIEQIDNKQNVGSN